MSGRLVDPVHFFDAMGRSMLTREFLDKRMEDLKAENAELKKKLKVAVDRIRKMTQTSDDQTLSG
jgi:hypothetical protein